MSDIVQKVSALLGRLADYYDILGDTYRATAFMKASKNIDDSVLSSRGHIPGFGKGIRDRISEIISTGTLAELSELEKDPKIIALRTLESVLGIGTITARALISKGIYSLDDLKRYSLEPDNGLTNMQQIGIKYHDRIISRIPRNILTLEYERIRKLLGSKDLIIVGSYRRGSVDSGDLDMLCTDVTTDEIISKLSPIAVLNHGEQKVSFLWKLSSDEVKENIDSESARSNNGIHSNTDKDIKDLIQVDIWVTPPEQFVAHLLYATGSRNHNILMRNAAKRKGFKLTQHGLYKGDKLIPLKSEEELYSVLNIKYVAPNDRI